MLRVRKFEMFKKRENNVKTLVIYDASNGCPRHFGMSFTL
jgi:hypothetical protein